MCLGLDLYLSEEESFGVGWVDGEALAGARIVEADIEAIGAGGQVRRDVDAVEVGDYLPGGPGGGEATAVVWLIVGEEDGVVCGIGHMDEGGIGDSEGRLGLPEEG